MGIFGKKRGVIEENAKIHDDVRKEDKKGAMDDVDPKVGGKLDMVFAFDTTGSMASYIGAVRNEVADLIPRLFKDKEDLRLGIVAFGTTATWRTLRSLE